LPEAAPTGGGGGGYGSEPAKTRRMVYFVGNLLGDEKSGGMTMQQLVNTIFNIWPADLGNPKDVVQFHNEAQLLVVNGTREQLDFIQQTLAALRQKVEAVRRESAGQKETENDLKELRDVLQMLKNMGGNSK
jgi:hypothetical protein